MKRFTVKGNEDHYIEKENMQAAIEKLAAFENLCEKISEDQESLSKELKTLRDADKTNSYHFKELMGKKLTNTNLLMVLSNHNLI